MYEQVQKVTPISMPRPFESRQEALVTQALQSALVPAQWLREMRPAARPQELFPDKSGTKEAWTIDAVLNVDRYTPTYRSWQSGMQVQRSTLAQGMEGTSRPSTQMQGG
jgi:hypothetical protein